MIFLFHLSKKQRGFTLVELLVVVSIVSLLSSIILASLKGARDKAVYTKAAVERRSLENALELYYGDHGDYYPVGARYFVDTVSTNWTTVFGAALAPYLKQFPVPSFESKHAPGSGDLLQGFLYAKGTKTSPFGFRIINGKTRAPVGCVLVYDGYWIDMVLPEQSVLSLNDGGGDPDGIEVLKGNVVIAPVGAPCP